MVDLVVRVAVLDRLGNGAISTVATCTGSRKGLPYVAVIQCAVVHSNQRRFAPLVIGYCCLFDLRL